MAGADKDKLGVGIEQRDTRFEPGRQPVVVMVEGGDIGPAQLAEAIVARADDTQILRRAHNTQPGIVASRKNVERIVARTVIDDDELEITEGLAEDAVNGIFDKTTCVVRRYENTHARHRRCA